MTAGSGSLLGLWRLLPVNPKAGKDARNSELIYDYAASKDKDFIAVEGATHGGLPCTACMPDGEAYDGRFDNAVANDFDYVADWIRSRF